MNFKDSARKDGTNIKMIRFSFIQMILAKKSVNKIVELSTNKRATKHQNSNRFLPNPKIEISVLRMSR